MDKLDRILRQLAISERRIITVKVACPLGKQEGSIESVKLDLSPEDIAARAEMYDALKITGDDLVVEIQRFCFSAEDYEKLLEDLPAVLSISPRT